MINAITFAQMLSARKYRLYPTAGQEALLARHFGCVRHAYNHCLEMKLRAREQTGKSLSRSDLQVEIKHMKTEKPWLKEPNSQSLQVVALYLTRAFSNYFEGRAGKPRFKSKRGRQSFHCPQNVGVADGELLLPKFRSGIPVRLHRPLGGSIRNATVSRDPSGKYYVSITIETGKPAPEPGAVKPSTAVGIDVGLTSFAVCSDGMAYGNPRHLEKSLQRLKVLQRRASHKQRGSTNRAKAQKKVATLHEKVACQRRDFLHKTSSEITNRYETVCVEDLCIAGMMGNHHLARAIGGAGWGMFLGFLRYKAAWKGGRVLAADRFAPTSKRHYGCGYVYGELKLSEREWRCPGCGERVARDENAAENIRYYAIRQYFSTYSGVERTGESVELSAGAEAMKQKASGGGRRPPPGSHLSLKVVCSLFQYRCLLK